MRTWIVSIEGKRQVFGVLGKQNFVVDADNAMLAAERACYLDCVSKEEIIEIAVKPVHILDTKQ